MLRLRPYHKSDGEYVVSWIKDIVTFRRWCADQYTTFPITADELNHRYEECAERGNMFAMTAFDENGVAGHLTMRFLGNEKKIVRFGFVIVDDTKRGKGYGREMLQLALTYAFEILKAEKVSIGVFENNIPARRCYESLGFRTGRGIAPTVYRLCGEKWTCLELEISPQDKEKNQK
jgi:RimJ/RimL family protein N-acetyltransferase